MVNLSLSASAFSRTFAVHMATDVRDRTNKAKNPRRMRQTIAVYIVCARHKGCSSLICQPAFDFRVI
jgi:hypothetical protein